VPSRADEPSLHDPHHDGSERYVTDPAPRLGAAVMVFVRVPHEAGHGAVWVRSTADAEPRYVEAVVDRVTPHERWLRAEVLVRNPDTGYRFAVEGGPGGYRWLNAGGTWDRDVTDADDFRLVTYAAPPGWLADAVAYQVFPDRFANSGRRRDWPSWATVSAWDDPLVEGRGATRQVYGGDLAGVEAHLDHLDRLGVNLLYLTPFFPARSSHRYDASSFDHVDPLLGGDEALVALVRAAHQRDLRVVADITINHSGSGHDWFTTAQGDPTSTEAGFYLFREHPDEYEAWLGVRSLPKFDLRDAELRRRLISGPGSVVGRYVSPPFDLDGWRVDVANMAGRFVDVDVNADVARAVRATLDGVRPDLYLVAEHCHDAHADLAGDGWHGTMSYAGFAHPVGRWLVGDSLLPLGFGGPMGLRRQPGGLMVEAVRAFAAGMPWRSLAASLMLLGSHDTARFRTVAGSSATALAGYGLLLTSPGVPMLFAGDEVGVEGVDADDARRPFPWDEAQWDRALHDGVRSLVALRRSSHALRHGGLRWAYAGDDVVAYLRESLVERVLVQVARAPHEPVRLPAGPLLDGGTAHLLYGDADLDVAGGSTILPSDGPAVRVWRLDP
jgi:alpha-glucosidase